jgi:hypothetical protein
MSTERTTLGFRLFGLNVAGAGVGSAEYMGTAINLSWEKSLHKRRHTLRKKKNVFCVLPTFYALTSVMSTTKYAMF